MEVKVEAGNEVIALFTGAVIKPEEDMKRRVFFQKGTKPISLNEFWCWSSCMEYHTSWDWLIPALKKAEQIIHDAGWGTATEKEAWRRLNAAKNEVFNLNIENAHYCFVKFIHWYNSIKKA